MLSAFSPVTDFTDAVDFAVVVIFRDHLVFTDVSVFTDVNFIIFPDFTDKRKSFSAEDRREGEGRQTAK